MREKSPAALVAGCASGNDTNDWEEFTRRFEARILGGIRRAYRRAGRPLHAESAQDRRQEVYTRLLENGRRALRECRGESEGEIGAYLARLAERLTLDHLRHTGADCRDRSKLQPIAKLAPLQSPRVQPRSEERLMARERLREFARVCRRVCRGDRSRDLELLRMAVIEGLSSREISARCGSLSVSGVDSRLSRLRQRLHRQGYGLARRPRCG